LWPNIAHHTGLAFAWRRSGKLQKPQEDNQSTGYDLKLESTEYKGLLPTQMQCSVTNRQYACYYTNSEKLCHKLPYNVE